MNIQKIENNTPESIKKLNFPNAMVTLIAFANRLIKDHVSERYRKEAQEKMLEIISLGLREEIIDFSNLSIPNKGEST